MTPTCIALLAILQGNPALKDNYPLEQRRECAIEQTEQEIRQRCYWRNTDEPGVEGCGDPREFATTLVDEMIRLKRSPNSLSPSEERAMRALQSPPRSGQGGR